MARFLVLLLAILAAQPACADVTVNGQLKNAQLELLSSDPTGKDGRLYYNTSTDLFKWYDLSSTTWRVAVDTTTAQTLAQKTLTSPVLNSPTMTTPTLGVASATSINKVAITAPASSATLTIADGKTLTASNTLTFTGTDSSSVAFGAGGTAAYTGGKLSQFASTTSSELAGVLSDEQGSAGGFVRATSPTLTTPVISSITNTGTITLPTATTTLVGRDTTDTLTAKDYDGGTASSTSRLTVPKASKSTLDGLTRKEATLVYASDVDKLYADDGSTLKEIGSGSGEKNYVQSPSNATGWTTSGTATATTTVVGANLPRENTTASGISLAAGSAADYVAYCFTVDDADKSRKLKAQFDMKPSSYTTGDFDIEVYSFATASCGGAATALTNNNGETSTDIPNYEGMFAVSFDTTTNDYYGIRFTRRAGSSVLVVSDVTVGPGVRSTGLAGGKLTTFTFTPNGTHTWSVKEGSWTRIGEVAVVDLYGEVTGSITADTGVFTVTLPTSLTVVSGNYAGCTMGQYETATTTSYDISVDIIADGTNVIKVGTAKYRDPIDLVDIDPNSNTRLHTLNCHSALPITTWVGNGTVNLLNDETLTEWTSDILANLISNEGTLANSNVQWRRNGPDMEVAFSTEMTSDAVGTVVFTVPNSKTIDTTKVTASANADQSLGPCFANDQGTAVYAGSAVYRSGTGIVFKFTNGVVSSGTPFGWGATDDWTCTFKIPITEWRGKSVGAVGFADVTQASGGLVKSAGQLLGTNTSDAASAGYVGEVLPADGSQAFSAVAAASSTNYAALKSVTLTAGDWEIMGQAQLIVGATTSFTSNNNNTVLIGTASASSSGGTAGLDRVDHDWPYTTAFSGSGGTAHTFTVFKHVTISAGVSTPYYLNGAAVYTSSAPTWSGFLRARRVR